ncbi:MFS transporter [Paraburkholderia caribensis]|nr:MFS transporter [Paraburkholderia caribensis]AMV44327.1 MFS transporter [Paraburkholderia caribensis]
MTTPFSAQTTRALRILSLAYFVQATGALSVVGSLDSISRQWGLADSQSVLLITVFGVTFAFAAPLLQVGFGHLRRRRQVLLGLALFSAAALLLAAAPNYPVLLVSRVLMGLGAGFIGPVLGALGSNLVDREHQGSAIATVLLGLSVAGLVGMPLSAWIAHAWGARSLFLVVGLAGAATAALIVWAVPDTSKGEDIELTTLISLLTRADTLSAFLVVFFIAAGVYSTYAFIAPIIRDVFHAGPDTVSTSLVVLGVAGVAGNLFVTRAARRYSAEAMLLTGLALLAADLVFLWFTPPSVHLLFVALTVWAFATDLLWPSQQRRIVELVPQWRGIALALTASFVFCGIGLGSAVAGWVYPVFGFTGAIASSLVFLALATGSLFVSRASVVAKNGADVCSKSLQS